MGSSRWWIRLQAFLVLWPVWCGPPAVGATATPTKDGDSLVLSYEGLVALRHVVTVHEKELGGEHIAKVTGRIEYPFAGRGIFLRLSSVVSERVEGDKRMARRPPAMDYICKPVDGAAVKETWRIESDKKPGPADLSTGVQIINNFLPCLSAAATNGRDEQHGVVLVINSLERDMLVSATMVFHPVRDGQGHVIAYAGRPGLRTAGVAQSAHLLFRKVGGQLEILRLRAEAGTKFLAAAREWFLGPRAQSFLAMFDQHKTDECEAAWYTTKTLKQ